MSISVAAIGVGFFSQRMAGDKNFWVDLLPLLSAQDLDVTVVSINDLPPSEDITPSQESPVGLVNWKRALHRGSQSWFSTSAGGNRDYRHKHNPLQEQLELVATLLARLPQLRRLVRDRNVQVIHAMDNMGFVMPVLKMLFPHLLITHSAMTYMPRGRNYDRYLATCFGKLDRIATYSEAYAGVLHRIGIEPSCVEVIRWGVVPGQRTVSPEDKHAMRSRLGLSDGEKLVVWSGPIQQIQEADFFDAVSAAQRIAAERKDVRFVFSFKPRSFKEDYRRFAGERITIGQPVVEFPLLLGSADFYLSPLRDLRSTLAPPLTWLEAMDSGVPIITTSAGGVEEVVVDGNTGYVARDMAETADAIIRAVDDPSRDDVSANCRKMIEAKYDIRRSAQAYAGMWLKALNDRLARRVDRGME